MKTLLYFEGVDCGNCAAKVEAYLNKNQAFEKVTIHFVLRQIEIHTKEDVEREWLRSYVENEAKKVESEIRIKLNQTQKQYENCQESTCQTKKKKRLPHDYKMLSRIGLGVFGLILGQMISLPIITVIAYLLVGYDILLKAFKNIIRGKLFDENFLMALATVSALIIKEYPEAVAVMVFYQIGEYLQHRAVDYSREAITSLMDIKPEFARVIRKGEYRKVHPEEVTVGEIIEVRAGEKIPLDGKVCKGSSTLDKVMLTGESLPELVTTGNDVLSGSINVNSVLEIQVEQTFKESTVSKILDMLQNAGSQKAKTEKFITRFAKWYTPLVVIMAVMVAIIPSMITGNWHEWIYNSIVFLVISCPCALVISIPLGFFGGIGAASKNGVLIKGSNYLEALSQIDTLVLDKTGTLTKGVFEVQNVVAHTKGEEQDVLLLAQSLEYYSNHPIATALVKKIVEGTLKEVQDYEEHAGYGLVGTIDGHQVLVGNEKLLNQYGIKVPTYDGIGTVVYVAVDQDYKGYVEVADQIKEESKVAIEGFKARGIKEVIMLTGDREKVAKDVGEKVGIHKIYSHLLPQDKVAKVEALIKEGKKVGFVGDGINDAPVLALADVGIAMGGVGSDVAIEASDVVLMTDQLTKLDQAIAIANQTKKVVMQNIIFAIGTKLIVMILGLMSIANMWLAVFADVGVSLIAILNALRLLKKR